MRAALYARVSTEEQLEGYSIDAQRRAFQALVQGREWTVCHEYIEAGRSAHTDDIRKRPVFKQAIDDALAGYYDVLVVHKIDRFSRKLKITLEYFDKLAKAGVGFVSIENQMDYSTPQGKFMLAMQGGLAELYSDNLSEETKKGWRERRAQGLYCGLLPFGAMKGDDGVPVPHPDTSSGLAMAFDLAAQGQTDREVVKALNTAGYRTAGNQGNRPFTRDTVRGILQNRFYLGELPDGNSGWVKGRHQSFIAEEVFTMAQEQRSKRRRFHLESVRSKAQTFSLSGLLWCKLCQSRMRIHRDKKGKPRLYCAGRSQGNGCSCRGTFLEVYEAQIQWYLEHFIIPNDYQERLIDAHRKLQDAYDDVATRCNTLENRLKRIKDLYGWGHLSKEEYLAEYEDIQRELKMLTPLSDKGEGLDKLAHFLSNVSDAWNEATEEQRNKLANTLFERVWVEHNRVVEVKPRPELRQFFQLSYEEHLKSRSCEPESHRGREQYIA